MKLERVEKGIQYLPHKKLYKARRYIGEKHYTSYHSTIEEARKAYESFGEALNRGRKIKAPSPLKETPSALATSTIEIQLTDQAKNFLIRLARKNASTTQIVASMIINHKAKQFFERLENLILDEIKIGDHENE